MRRRSGNTFGTWDENWNDISERFREGESWHLEFFVHKKKDKPQKLTYFDVFLEQDRKMLTPKEFFCQGRT